MKYEFADRDLPAISLARYPVIKLSPLNESGAKVVPDGQDIRPI